MRRTGLAIVQECVLRRTRFHGLHRSSARGECLALRWSDLDLKTKRVVFLAPSKKTRSGLSYKSTKSGRARVLSLPNFVLAVLGAHRASQAELRLALGPAYRDDDLVFARYDGVPYRPHTFGDAFRALVRRAGVRPIRLHDLRHTHASLMGKAGVPMKVVSERLGHATTAITADVYSHVFASQDAEAAAAFEALVRGGTWKEAESSL